ncbi:MAG: hypothetical protein KAX39_01670 [candidate division Zixibacteria bacterium]|nr:hypothetical protein [candidate division Zixibacteria bacterium]
MVILSESSSEVLRALYYIETSKLNSGLKLPTNSQRCCDMNHTAHTTGYLD